MKRIGENNEQGPWMPLPDLPKPKRNPRSRPRNVKARQRQHGTDCPCRECHAMYRKGGIMDQWYARLRRMNKVREENNRDHVEP